MDIWYSDGNLCRAYSMHDSVQFGLKPVQIPVYFNKLYSVGNSKNFYATGFKINPPELCQLSSQPDSIRRMLNNA